MWAPVDLSWQEESSSFSVLAEFKQIHPSLGGMWCINVSSIRLLRFHLCCLSSTQVFGRYQT